MTDLIINPVTKQLLDAYLAEPSHALLLTGQDGVGLGTIAGYLASELSDSNLTVETISPEKGTITIAQVQQLYRSTRSSRSSRRMIIVDDADTMGNEAQNALLKLLEEPVSKVHFILTTHRPDTILPTIASRAQSIDVMPVDRASSVSLLETLGAKETKHTQMLFLAQGRPAELSRLVADEVHFRTSVAVIRDAKAFLQASRYDKLAILKGYSDRKGALVFLNHCALLLGFSLLKQKNTAFVEAIHTIDHVSRRIDANGHTKTQLLYLVTKLG